MSIQPAPHALLFADFLPQAEFQYPVEEMRDRLNLVQDCDDLDDFTGGAFAVNEWKFTIKHYKGNAPDTFTVYFPRDTDLGTVKELVHMIIKDFDLPASSLKWGRSEDADF